MTLYLKIYPRASSSTWPQQKWRSNEFGDVSELHCGFPLLGSIGSDSKGFYDMFLGIVNLVTASNVLDSGVRSEEFVRPISALSAETPVFVEYAFLDLCLFVLPQKKEVKQRRRTLNVMDKDCRRHLGRERIDRIGCVWVFISMFDFRHGGSTQKLLTDKKRGSKRITGNGLFGAKHDKSTCSCESNSHRILGGEDGLVKSESGTLSVKTLIEEEMSAMKDTEDDKKTRVTCDSECRGPKEGDRKRRNKSCSKSLDGISVPITSDDHVGTDGGKDSDERSVSRERNNDVHYKADEMNDDCEEKFTELIKRLIAQKEGEIQSCKDLLGAFQVLGSHEPGTPLVGDSQRMEEEDFRTVEGDATQSGAERKKRKFFNRKGKSPERSSSGQNSTSQSPRTIVILKPGPNSSDIGSSLRPHSMVKKARKGGLGYRFVLGVIKRILKSAANNEPCDGLHDGASEAVSDLSQNCCMEEEVHANAGSGRNETDKEFCSEGTMTDENREDTAHTSNDSKKSTSGIYIAAKKHLSEMLANGDIDVNLPSKEVPRILGRILSLPQFSSPVASPRRSSAHDFVSHPSPLSHTAEKPKIQPCSSDDCSEPRQLGSDDLVDEDSDKHDETIGASDAAIPEGVSSASVEAETMDEIQMIELYPLSETCSSSGLLNVKDVDEDALTCHDKDGDKKPLKQFHETFGEGQSSSPPESPPNSSVRMTECQETATDVPGKLSPVSVLEPLFTDDDMSPEGCRSRSGEMRLRPLCIRFDEPVSPKADQDKDSKTCVDDKESTLAYIKAVIQASGFDWEKLIMKSFHTDQLVEPDLINDIDFCSNQLCDDKKLLFDCIDEVLMEFCRHEFGSGPWISFVKPTIWISSDTEDVVKVVKEEVFWHLQPLPFPHTLDQIVRKDMARTGNWMDLRFDIGCVGADTGETILDEILEETIRSCIDLVLLEPVQDTISINL